MLLKLFKLTLYTIEVWKLLTNNKYETTVMKAQNKSTH